MSYFKANELVCPHVFEKFKDRSLMFADPRLLEWLEWFRKTIDKPVIINNYGSGGNLSQRGYRCNICSIVKDKTAKDIMYLSSHTRFQGADLSVPGMKDEAVRKWIADHAAEMPHNIRIETKTIGWVHVDVGNDTKERIIYFNP